MCDACCSSTEHAVQKPATTGWTFTEQPETDTGARQRDVIVTANIVAVPPARLDALRPGDERALPAVVWLRLDQHPQRSFGARDRPLAGSGRTARLRDAPRALGTMLRYRADTEHGVLPEPCAQAVEQPRGRFRIRTLAALEEPGIAQRQRQQHAGTQTQRTDRRRQPLPCEPLGD